MEVREVKRLKIGLIGYGPFGQHLARTALNTTKADIAMVWTRSCETAERIRRDGFCATNDVDELIRSPEVEAVIVASPNALHKEHALKVCAARKPLWAEKPLVLNLADYDEILRAVEKAGIKNHCNYNMRYGGVFRKMIEMADQGEFGQPLHLITRSCRGTGLFSLGSPHKAVLEPDLSGGWLLHHTGHQVDFALRLMRQRVVRVYGSVVKSAAACPSEESIAAICTTERGAIIEIADGVGPQADWYQMFLGSKASAVVTDRGLCFRGSDKENKDRYGQGGQSILYTPEAYGDDAMRGFIAHVTGGESGVPYPVPVIPISEGRHVLEVLLAIRESAKSGRAVDLPPPQR